MGDDDLRRHRGRRLRHLTVIVDQPNMTRAQYARIASNDIAEQIHYLLSRGLSPAEIQAAFNAALIRVALSPKG
jgi:ribulose bisphosphate carboxylase small subunit